MRLSNLPPGVDPHHIHEHAKGGRDVCPSTNDDGIGCVHDAGHTGRHHGVGASWPQEDTFGAWLDRQRCHCGDRATHRDNGGTVCNKHMSDDARALND